MDLSPFSCPPFSLEESREAVIVSTETLRAEISLNGLKTRWFRREETEWLLYAEDRPSQAYNFEGELGEGVFHFMKRKRSDLYWGLGEKAGELNRHGNRYIMNNVDPMGYDAKRSDPLYKHIPFFMVKEPESRTVYGLFYDNFSVSTFDMGCMLDNYHGLFRHYHAAEGDLDYYMMVEPSVSGMVKRISWLYGQTALMPRWSIGYSGIHHAVYRCSPMPRSNLRGFWITAGSTRSSATPSSSPRDTLPSEEKRYVFNWNREKFPDPRAFSDSYHQAGVKLCANIKPAFLVDHPLFGEMKERGLFIRGSRNG